MPRLTQKQRRTVAAALVQRRFLPDVASTADRIGSDEAAVEALESTGRPAFRASSRACSQREGEQAREAGGFSGGSRELFETSAPELHPDRNRN